MALTRNIDDHVLVNPGLAIGIDPGNQESGRVVWERHCPQELSIVSIEGKEAAAFTDRN